MSASTPHEGIRIDLSRHGTTAVARICGSADMTATEAMKEHLLSLADGPSERIILDLSGLEFISSEGLGAIIAAHMRCRPHKERLVLAAPREPIRHLLAVTRLDRLFSIYESVDQAMRSEPRGPAA